MAQDFEHGWVAETRCMLLLLGLCLLQGACSSLPKGELSLDAGIKDRGVASWYGQAFHGKLAANGEAFDMTGTRPPTANCRWEARCVC